MVFVMRKLDRDPQTLGEKLRALRRGQAVSMDTMERTTHIQRNYLLALEKGDYAALPEPLYTRNFIRSYARVLHADENYFLELYMEECGRCDLVEPLRNPRQRMRRMKLFVWNRFAAFAFFGVVMTALLGYLGFEVTSITAPPELLIFSPTEASLSHEAHIVIEGIVEREASVFVNGEQIAVHEDRTFSYTVDLEKGLNIIQIEAERRYSRRAILERTVVFEPTDGFAVNNSLHKVTGVLQ